MKLVRTTYEEISTCPKLNRAYWTEQARFNLALMRESGANAPRLRLAFRANMHSRRNQEYLLRDTDNPGAEASHD